MISTTSKISFKKVAILVLCTLFSCFASAKESKYFVIKQGDPLVLLQENKSAIYEIDYSKMMVTEGKDHENDLDFYSWMQSQDEDNDKWVKDWEKEDKAACNKEFRERFNDEIDHGIKLTKLGKNYKVILRLKMIDFGPAVKYGFGGIQGGEAKADGELEVRDINSDEILLVLEFNKIKGESSFKQIGRLKGVFENLCENLNDYLEDYQKEQKKLAKKKK